MTQHSVGTNFRQRHSRQSIQQSLLDVYGQNLRKINLQKWVKIICATGSNTV